MSQADKPDPKKRAKYLTKLVLKELYACKGFGWWWDDISTDTQREIKAAIATVIQKGLEKDV